MTDSTKTVVTSASSKQALPYRLGPLEQIQQKQKSFPGLQFTQLNSVSTSLLEKK